MRSDHAGRAKVAAARKRPLPDIGKRARRARRASCRPFVEPSLAAACDKPPSGAKWVHEIKHDGYRIQARIDGGKVQLLTRKGLDWTERFRSIADALDGARLGSALIDGEIVVEDEAGMPSFSAAAGGPERRPPGPLALLRLRSALLRGLRSHAGDARSSARRCCSRCSPDLPPAVADPLQRASRETTGRPMLEHACRLGLEGIVSKRADLALPVRARRAIGSSRKCTQSQEFVILGYVPVDRRQRRGRLAAARLLRGRQAPLCRPGRHRLFGDQARGAAQRRSTRSPRRSPTLANALPAGAEKGVRWVEPRLVCEVEFAAGPRTARAPGLVQGPARGQAGRGGQPRRRTASRAPSAKPRPDRRVTAHPSGRILWPRRASPSRAWPSSTPRSPTGSCRTSRTAC